MSETIAQRLREVADEVSAGGGRLLLMPEVSERTRITIDGLRWLRGRGEGPPSYRLGKRVVYPERELVEWMRLRREEDSAAVG